MSSAVAQSLDGALVASVAVSADEATPRARLLAVRVEVAANSAAPQLALVASELVAVALVVVSADAVAAVAASAAIEVVSGVDLEAEAVVDVVTLVVVVEGLVTNPMATVLPTARQQVRVAHEAVASVAIEEVAADLEAIELEAVEDAMKIVVVVVEVASTEVPAVLTMNRSVAEIGIVIATVVDTVEAETTLGSAVTKATTTTIRDSAADISLTRCWLGCFHSLSEVSFCKGLSKGYLPFLRLTFTLSRL